MTIHFSLLFKGINLLTIVALEDVKVIFGMMSAICSSIRLRNRPEVDDVDHGVVSRTEIVKDRDGARGEAEVERRPSQELDRDRMNDGTVTPPRSSDAMADRGDRAPIICQGWRVRRLPEIERESGLQLGEDRISRPNRRNKGIDRDGGQILEPRPRRH